MVNTFKRVTKGSDLVAPTGAEVLETLDDDGGVTLEIDSEGKDALVITLCLGGELDVEFKGTLYDAVENFLDWHRLNNVISDPAGKLFTRRLAAHFRYLADVCEGAIK